MGGHVVGRRHQPGQADPRWNTPWQARVVVAAAPDMHVGQTSHLPQHAADGWDTPGPRVEVEAHARDLTHDGQPLACVGIGVEVAGDVDPDDADAMAVQEGQHAAYEVGPPAEPQVAL